MPITKGALALGSAIIGGSGGGDTSDLEDLINDYAKGRIICDTSTFSVGDTIRVRSMTDSSKVWNQQVATVGTALVFTVPPYDYYKICTVQTIDDTPTEIGGVYKTVDYGQTLFMGIADFDKHSLAYVQSVLNNHQENHLLNIGDEFTIKINEGGTPKDWTMQIGAINLYDTHEAILVSKNIYKKMAYGNNYGDIENYLNGTFYNSIDEADRAYLKDYMMSFWFSAYSTWSTPRTNKVWVPNKKEIDNAYAGSGTPAYPQYQYPIFTTSANRMRQFQGSNLPWWMKDSYSSANTWVINTLGNSDSSYANTLANVGVLPCFHLTADS